MRIDRWPASVAWARILFAVFTNDNQNQGKLLIVADCGLPHIPDKQPRASPRSCRDLRDLHLDFRAGFS
jgi:hypothetical protein